MKAEKCSQKIILAENQEQSVIQNTITNDNPAVALSLNIKNYDTPSTSVRKELYEASESDIIHHSKTTVDGKGTKKGKTLNKIKNYNIESEVNLTELALRSSFEFLHQTSLKFFEVITKMMASNLV